MFTSGLFDALDLSGIVIGGVAADWALQDPDPAFDELPDDIVAQERWYRIGELGQEISDQRVRWTYYRDLDAAEDRFVYPCSF